MGTLDPVGVTAAISFPIGLVAEASAIRLISGHEHDTLDPMTAFTAPAHSSRQGGLFSSRQLHW